MYREVLVPATHYIENDKRIIFTIWQGDASDDDLISALQRYQSDIKSNPEYANYNELVNLLQVTGGKLSFSGLTKIGQLASGVEPGGVKTKLALVVKSGFAYSLAKMYQVYRTVSHKSNKEIRVFNRERDALEWLRGVGS